MARFNTYDLENDDELINAGRMHDGDPSFALVFDVSAVVVDSTDARQWAKVERDQAAEKVRKRKAGRGSMMYTRHATKRSRQPQKLYRQPQCTTPGER